MVNDCFTDINIMTPDFNAACQGTDTADDIDSLTGQSDCGNPEGNDGDMDLDAGIYPCENMAGEIFCDILTNVKTFC